MDFSSRQRGVRRAVTMAALVAVAAVLLGYLSINTSVAGGTSSDSEFTAVPPVEVCMVTDRVFGKPQIPVEYEGRTYYGCCGGCVSRIKNDSQVRYSVDPVSGAEVDKATAVIVEGPGGAAMYFESMATAREYLSKEGK